MFMVDKPQTVRVVMHEKKCPDTILLIICLKLIRAVKQKENNFPQINFFTNIDFCKPRNFRYEKKLLLLDFEKKKVARF